MRTRTIFEAYADLEFENGQTWEAFAADMKPRKARQLKAFRDELLRRMDERDALVASRRVFLTPERIGQYMARLSEDMKADDILRGGK